MLLHENYILFFVNLKVVVEFHSKVKCTNCILYVKCVSAMAESDKKLVEDGKFSNNNRNNSVPSIVPHSSGTMHPDTHPTHHAAVSEPSTLKRKQTSFQITSVTVKGSRLSTDGGEDSADDLDESHTEDVSSDILDCSRTTDADNDQLSEDNTTNNDEASNPDPSIPVQRELSVKLDQQNDAETKVPSESSNIDKPSLSCENTENDFVKSSALPDQWQHRFRVVKIVSSEPFKRGRWLCMDFMDPPAPVTEAKAEIIETAVSSNIQLLSGSITENIPADKIAHIYEISPHNAYPGSISVSSGSDQIQQPMYGIFLPLNNGQYPLITGMHSRAIRPIDREIKMQESGQSVSNDSGAQRSSTTQQPNIPANSQQSRDTITTMQQTQNVTPSVQQLNSTTIQQVDTSAALNQTNIASSMQQVNVSGTQPTTSNMQQATTSAGIQKANVSIGMQQANTSGVIQHTKTSDSMQQASTSVDITQASTACMQPTQNSTVSMSQVSTSAGMQQTQNSTVGMQQMQNIVMQQSPNVIVGSQQTENVANMQQAHNVKVGIDQSQNVIAGVLQSQNDNLAQNISASVQPSKNISNNQQSHNVSNVQQQNIGMPQHVTSMQPLPKINTSLNQPQQVYASFQQSQQAAVTILNSQQVDVNNQQPHRVDSLQQPQKISILQQQHPVTSLQQQQPVSNLQQQQPVSNLQQQKPISNMQQPVSNLPQHQQPVNNLPQQQQQPVNNLQQPVSGLQQQPVSSLQHQQQPVSSLQQPIGGLQQQQPISSLQQQQQAVASLQQQQQQTLASLQQQQAVASLQQQQAVVSLQQQQQQQQPVASLQHQQQPVASLQQQQQPVASLQQQPVTSIQQQQPVASLQQQQQPVTSLQQQQPFSNLQQQQQPVSNLQQQQPVSSLPQQQQQVNSLSQQQQQVNSLPQQQIHSILQHPHPVFTNMVQQQSQQVHTSLSQPSVTNLQHPQPSSLQQFQSIPVSLSQTQIPNQSVSENQVTVSSQGMPVVLTQNMQTSSLPASNKNVLMDTTHQAAVSDSLAVGSVTTRLITPPQSQLTPLQTSQESQKTGQDPSAIPSGVVHTALIQSLGDSACTSTVEIPSMSQVGEAPLSSSVSGQLQISGQISTVGTQASSVVNIPEATTTSCIQSETVVPSQVTQNHVEAKELGTPPSTNLQVSQEVQPEGVSMKNEVNGEESESVPSGTSTVAIDNKIEQAMDLVKSHLMFAVREEVDVLKEKITELMDRISQLEYENGFLKANASQQTLEQLNQSQLLQQQQQQQQNQPSSVSMNSIPQVSQQQQLNIQNQQPTS